MQITLYLADIDEYLKHFTLFFDEENITVHTDKCFLGYCIEFECEEAFLNKLCACIARFVMEFHLKEAILSKIYDEYISLDINDAGMLLKAMADNISDTVIYKRIFVLLQKSGKLCIDSFIIFNIKPIMQSIYAKVDTFAEAALLQKEKDAFVAMLKTYSGLNFKKCKDASVEFSSDYNCCVSLDNSLAETVNADKLLSILTEYSPDTITLKNSGLCPEISELVRDVFGRKVFESK